jgi:flagellar biogenesis protein FliO
MNEQALELWAVPLWVRAQALWRRIARARRRSPRGLRIAETVSLGEHRFVAVIEFEQSRFLLGGTSSSLVLLADLGGKSPGAVNVCDAKRAVSLAGGAN